MPALLGGVRATLAGGTVRAPLSRLRERVGVRVRQVAALLVGHRIRDARYQHGEKPNPHPALRASLSRTRERGCKARRMSGRRPRRLSTFGSRRNGANERPETDTKPPCPARQRVWEEKSVVEG